MRTSQYRPLAAALVSATLAAACGGDATSGSSATGASQHQTSTGSTDPTNPGSSSTPPAAPAWTPGKPGRFLYVSNTNLRNVSVYAIDATSGVISQIAGSPFPSSGADEGASCTVVSPAADFLYCPNNFSVSVYSINSNTGALSEITGSPFQNPLGPNSITLNAAGNVAYETNFVHDSVTAYQVNSDGSLSNLEPQLSGAHVIPAGRSPADLALTPTEKFAYAVNSAMPGGYDISAYTVDPATWILHPIAGPLAATGTTPRAIRIEPAGKFAYVANRDSNNLSGYSIDQTTGQLTALSGSPFAAGQRPNAMVIHPSGQFLYVANNGEGTVSGYAIDAGTGSLTPVAGSPFPADVSPNSIAIEGSGRFLYVDNFGSGSVSVYSIEATSGVLTQITGSPFKLLDNSRTLAIAE